MFSIEKCLLLEEKVAGRRPDGCGEYAGKRTAWLRGFSALSATFGDSFSL